ncbi:hypothetical protein, partial [Vreelandella hamiltonii]|uniref:hypothetical protein n=1 Tax=Vreelandella hamiltonii TaxID=502829 RepID=UPI001E5DA5E3
VGHGTVWVNGDNGYIAMQVSGLEVLPGAGLTDSGSMKASISISRHFIDITQLSRQRTTLSSRAPTHDFPLPLYIKNHIIKSKKEVLGAHYIT